MQRSDESKTEAASKPSRREMLNYMWVGAMALLSAQAVGFGVHYALPRFKAGEFGGRFNVGRVVDLPSPGDPPLNVPKGKFWLVRTDQYLVALYKACTHLDCMFDWNPLEGKFICPCHGSQFALDGRLLSGPAPRSLDHFQVQIISPGGEILAQTDPEKGLQMPPTAEVDRAEANTPAVSPAAADAIPSDALVWVDTGHRIKAGPQTG
jgi:cytochrome b6-f complex iron-sulfur subunit